MTDFELAHAYDTVNLFRRAGAVKVQLNRPDRMNAWDEQLAVDLLDALLRAGEDEEVRAVMIVGAGRAFSSGADLRAPFDPTPDGHPDLYARLTRRYHPIMRAVREMPKPVLAAVNGPAAGIGCSLAICSDLVVAAESAYFLLAFVNIGLAPDGGSSLFIPARVGYGRAAEMAMLGEPVPAPLALEWGLVNRVFDDGSFEEEADALLERLASGPTRSYAATKRQLNHWIYDGMEEQLELEAQIQQKLAATRDFAEGVGAFVEKRAAGFVGR